MTVIDPEEFNKKETVVGRIEKLSTNDSDYLKAERESLKEVADLVYESGNEKSIKIFENALKEIGMALSEIGEVETYSRIVGYFRPVKDWNKGKVEEFKERETFNVLQEK